MLGARDRSVEMAAEAELNTSIIRSLPCTYRIGTGAAASPAPDADVFSKEPTS